MCALAAAAREFLPCKVLRLGRDSLPRDGEYIPPPCARTLAGENQGRSFGSAESVRVDPCCESRSLRCPLSIDRVSKADLAVELPFDLNRRG